MNSAVVLREGTCRRQFGEMTSLTGSSIKTGIQAQHEEVNFGNDSSRGEKYVCPGMPIEKVTCTGVQMSYPKGPGQDSYSKLTEKPLEVRDNCGGGGSRGAGLRLASTRVTVYPQRDIKESWKGRRDFSLPSLDVLKVQLESRGPGEEQGTSPRSLSVPNSAWLPLAWDLGRTRSADSYFRHGQRQGANGPHFQTRVQMERAFNEYVNSTAQPVSPGRPNTRTSTYSSRQASASSNYKDKTDKPPTLTWYSAPNRQRVVRKSPPWRSLMNRRPRGLRADNSNLCPYHCRCCFNEVNDIESCTVYKMDLGAL